MKEIRVKVSKVFMLFRRRLKILTLGFVKSNLILKIQVSLTERKEIDYVTSKTLERKCWNKENGKTQKKSGKRETKEKG